jgi:RNA polymerase sigma-70 factor (ECF subfamily)
MPDLQLARQLLNGDDSAFEAFFADYFPRVFRFALVRVRDEDAAEDIAQCTLIKAVEKLHTYRGEAAMFTWVCTLCRHEIARWHERTGKAAAGIVIEDRPELRAVLDSMAAAQNDPEKELRSQELARLVRVTLDELPAHYGNALEWRYIEELSVDEVAARLGLRYKAAESLLTRARQAFRECFSVLAGGWPAENAR